MSNETPQPFDKSMLRGLRQQYEQQQEVERQRQLEQTRLVNEAKEVEFQKRVQEFEQHAIDRATKGEDWMFIDRIDYFDIDFQGERTLVSTSQIMGDKRRLMDHFESKGLTAILGKHQGVDGSPKANYQFLAVTWGEQTEIHTSGMHPYR